VTALAVGGVSQLNANAWNQDAQKLALTTADKPFENAIRTEAAAANVFYGLTGLAVVGGVAVFLVNPHMFSSSGGSANQPAVRLSGAGVQGSF
jgi:hypothetical protein